MREINNISTIRVLDIPAEGLAVKFSLDGSRASERANAPSDILEEVNVKPPRINFDTSIPVSLELSLEGATVYIRGSLAYSFTTSCAMCLKPAKYSDNLEIQLVLKKQSSKPEDDDVGFGHYSGEDIDCSDIVEEFLLLSLPYTVYCSFDCKGLCPRCGKDLNSALCECKDEEIPHNSSPFSKLKDIKIQ